MTEYLIIAAAVLWAVLYSTWALLPAALRRASAELVARWATRLGMGAGKAGQLRATLARPTGCGACSTCAGCGSKPPAPAQRPDPPFL